MLLLNYFVDLYSPDVEIAFNALDEYTSRLLVPGVSHLFNAVERARDGTETAVIIAAPDPGRREEARRNLPGYVSFRGTLVPVRLSRGNGSAAATSAVGVSLQSEAVFTATGTCGV